MAVNSDPKAQWFQEASLGFFIHWGISSVAGVDISWGMLRDCPWNSENIDVISPEEYYKLAESFNPEAYDPDKWLKAARQAGFEYAVFTTRHHDGYAMWPTEYGSFGVKQFMNGRDLVEEFIHACRRQNLKVGLYYSLPDWIWMSDSDGKQPDMEQLRSYESLDNARNALSKISSIDDLFKFERYYQYIKGQIKELITRYGKIDLMWFDGNLWWDDIRMCEILIMIRTAQPHIVINDRADRILGDYKTPEAELPERQIDGWWEVTLPWHTGWSYTKNQKFRSMDWTMEILARAASWGGNVLFDLGPTVSGELTKEGYELIDQLGEWMRYNAPSVKGVDRGKWPSHCELPVTRRGNIWFIHLLKNYKNLVTIRDVPAPKSVTYLRNHDQIEYEYKSGNLTFQIHEINRMSVDEVITVTWAGDCSFDD